MALELTKAYKINLAAVTSLQYVLELRRRKLKEFTRAGSDIGNIRKPARSQCMNVCQLYFATKLCDSSFCNYHWFCSLMHL